MFHHILVPLDGSACAEEALPMAARIARATGASITLARVIKPRLVYPYFLEAGPFVEQADTNEEEVNPEARAYLIHVMGFDCLKGISVKGVLLHGEEVHTELEHFAESRDISLIVMCSHGATGIKRWLLDEHVAQHLVRISARPVLIMHEGAALPTVEQDPHPFRVLVALDGSLRAETALLPAADLSATLSAPQRGRLHLLRIVPPALAPTLMVEGAEDVSTRLDAQSLAEARDYLDEVAWCVEKGNLASYHLHVTSEAVLEADVVHTLVKIAQSGQPNTASPAHGGYDAIAITTHGRHGLPRWFMGSVTEHILGKTRLPLLVIRQPNDFAPDAEQVPAILMGPVDRENQHPRSSTSGR